MRSRFYWQALALFLCLVPALSSAQTSKPAITLDEYLNTTDITDARLSPDGSAAVIATEAPDWKDSIFRQDLWLWTEHAGLRPLTHSGSEQYPQWSPDGKWIAFVSDRALPGEKATSDGGPEDESAKADRIWIIAVSGGEALPLFREKLDVHKFAWSPDSSSIYYSVTEPLTKAQKETQKNEWKDMIRWREQDHGDLLVEQAVKPALARAVAVPLPVKPDAKSAPGTTTAESADSLPPSAKTIAKSAISIEEIAPSPDGKSIAFLTGPVHHRVENPADFEIFIVPASGGDARQITHNQALESSLRWAPDSHSVALLRGRRLGLA